MPEGATPPAPPASCEVCGAPALPVRGACVFCASPLEQRGDPAGLVSYLAARLPGATVRRSGLVRRGPPQRVEFTVGKREFRAQLRKGTLELTPAGSPESWAAEVVRSLAALAPDSREQRAILSRTGWSWA